MTKYISIKNKIYPFKFHIFLNYKNLDDIVRDIKLRLRKDKKLLETELKECLPINLEGYAGFAYEYKGNIIIMTKDFEDRPVDWNTLTHEIGHAVFKAARYIGLTYSEGPEEFFTYHLGFIMQEIKTALLKDCSKK